MRKMICLIGLIAILVSCSDKRTVLEVAKIDEYYRVTYYEEGWYLWVKSNHTWQERLYTEEGLNNFFKKGMTHNMSSWVFE